ncbi:MAG: globin domain-containing protein [Alphaproteobacteria bacterium]|nr:globin domain-containing protein [Alphaproteobacteria bacterium]
MQNTEASPQTEAQAGSSEPDATAEQGSDIQSEIQGLQEEIERVGTVADQIEHIAKQTNLLALNATIEAARAGDAGKGFAVVAGEVKQLAGQTSRATTEITETLQKLTDRAVRLATFGEQIQTQLDKAVSGAPVSEPVAAAASPAETSEPESSPTVVPIREPEPEAAAPAPKPEPAVAPPAPKPAAPAAEDGPITAQQKALVQETFAKVDPIAEQAAELFYKRLFELDPSLRDLFKVDIMEQGRKLMSTMKVAVAGLDDLGKLVPVLEALGAKHKAYGVVQQHYDTVGEALLWTLEQGLADAFTDEVRDAWVAVYGLVAEHMLRAAESAPGPADMTKPAPAPAEPAAPKAAAPAAPAEEAAPAVPAESAPAEAESPITARQKALVQETFAKVEPIAEQAAEMFYNRLFELDPSLKKLFKTDLKEQGRKLMGTLKVAVAGLDDLAKLKPALEALGVRHKDYGVKDQHYLTVAKALLWTLEQGLGDAFTEEVREAWTAVYSVLAAAMIEAAAAA